MSPDDYRRSSGYRRSEPETRAQTITQNASHEEILAFFGLDTTKLPIVNSMSAMKVPAFAAGVLFLARTMATMDLAAWRTTKAGPEKVGGRLQTIIGSAPNPEWSAWAARFYFWVNVFKHGRGLFAILRYGNQPWELWPMNPAATSISMDAFGRKSYTVSVGTTQPLGKTFPAADVIDIPFMLAENMVNAISPVMLGERALQLALAMNEYGATFFAGGGVPPLALEGPLATGKEAMQRQMADVHRAIEAARSSEKPVFPMPAGYKLNQVGYDPAKGQMTEARLFQIQEIGRILQLPPVFLGDLSGATFANSEQQDLQLVKHLIGQWAKAFEDEANLKLFGQTNNSRYVRHDLDSLMRGDFLSRLTGLAQGVQNALITPDEGRAILGTAAKGGNADKLFIQSATVPIDSMGKDPAGDGNDKELPPAGGNDNGGDDDVDQAA